MYWKITHAGPSFAALRWCIIDILTLGPDWTLEIVAHTSQEGEQRGIEATMSSPVRNLGDVGKML